MRMSRARIQWDLREIVKWYSCPLCKEIAKKLFNCYAVWSACYYKQWMNQFCHSNKHMLIFMFCLDLVTRNWCYPRFESKQCLRRTPVEWTEVLSWLSRFRGMESSVPSAGLEGNERKRMQSGVKKYEESVRIVIKFVRILSFFFLSQVW